MLVPRMPQQTTDGLRSALLDWVCLLVLMVRWVKLLMQTLLLLPVVMLSSLLEVTRAYIYSLLVFFRTFWPLSLVYGPTLQQPSLRTRKYVRKAIRQLKRGNYGSSTETTTEEERDDQVMHILQHVPPDEDILTIVDDEDGFDVLQYAIIADRKDVVSCLLRTGCCPNRYHCSPPLHMAAQLGRVGMLELLIREGKADMTARRGMCFPHRHRPIGSQYCYFGFSIQQVYHCSNPETAFTPMECAIAARKLRCVQILTETLLERHKVYGTPSSLRIKFNPLTHLHYACREGAWECIHYFVERFPDCINAYTLDGDTPLLTAVPWGKECVKILVNNGADVHLLSKEIGETALHRLYRMNIDGLFTIYDTTRYLLTTGIEQDINACTTLKETPLHMLVSHVSYAGGNYVDPTRCHRPRNELQRDYQKQVLMAIRELLKFNADPLLENRSGLQPLSRMLHIALKAVHRTNQAPCVYSSQPDCFIVEYENDYSTLAHAMTILLEHGAVADFCCSHGHTPLVLLITCFLFDDAQRLVAQKEAALHAVKVLVSYGSNVNLQDKTSGSTMATLLAKICRRSLEEHAVRTDPALQKDLGDFTNRLLVLLLAYGLNPNYRSEQILPFLTGGNGNALIEFVRLSELATTPQDFELLETWLVTLLRWGADPDLEPYQSEPIICHSQSSIFLKRQGSQPVSLCLQKARPGSQGVASNSVALEREVVNGMRQLLYLFYNSMEHKPLQDCLLTVRGMARFHSHSLDHGANRVGPTAEDSLMMTVHMMAEMPRTLKQIARITVYKALDRRVAERVEGLPLPRALKDYLLNFS